MYLVKVSQQNRSHLPVPGLPQDYLSGRQVLSGEVCDGDQSQVLREGDKALRPCSSLSMRPGVRVLQ